MECRQLQHVPLLAEFHVKVKLLVERGRGGGVRANILRLLRKNVLSISEIATILNMSNENARRNVYLLHAYGIVRRELSVGKYYGMKYLLSQDAKIYAKQFDEILGIPLEERSTVIVGAAKEIVWMDYGTCCKSCQRGYDTPRYKEPCLGCKVARSNFIPIELKKEV